jgi:hypothetical protein
MTTYRELDRRVADAGRLEIALLWHPMTNAIVLAVEDAETHSSFTTEVPADNALDAFWHPFAYATERPLVAA